MHRAPAALLLVALAACNGGGDDPEPTTSTSCRADTLMDTYSTDDGVVHTDHPSYTGPLGNPPQYRVDPPSGGDHLSPSAPPGFYVGEKLPPDGVLVHSLEHGYVIVWFRSEAEAQAAREVADEYPRDVIVVERPSLSVPIAATAWGHRLLCDEPDVDALTEFAEDRRNEAPEKIPH